MEEQQGPCFGVAHINLGGSGDYIGDMQVVENDFQNHLFSTEFESWCLICGYIGNAYEKHSAI